MRIRELLESKYFNDAEFVTPTEGGRELNFDLAEDLIYFMNHDDDVYRRHVFPSIARCLDNVNENRPIKPGMFRPAVEQSYKIYAKKYPIRELPDSLDEQVCKDICTKIHDEFKKHVEEGKYKD